MHAGPLDADVDERRVAHAVEEEIHDLAAGILQAEIRDGAPADAGHALEQVAVHRRADAEAENARVAEANTNSSGSTRTISTSGAPRERHSAHRSLQAIVEEILDAYGHAPAWIAGQILKAETAVEGAHVIVESVRQHSETADILRQGHTSLERVEQ